MLFLTPFILSLNLITLPPQSSFYKRALSLEYSKKDLIKTKHIRLKKDIQDRNKVYPREQLSSGGLVKLYFNERPDIYINDKKVNVFSLKQEEGWLILIPISLYKESKVLILESKTTDKSQIHTIKLHKADYQVQHIKVKNREFVKASKKTLSRIYKESALKKQSLELFSHLYCKNLKMIKPLNSKLRHDFGKRRFFNGVAKNPHAGIDLSGKKGDKIIAPLSGEVIILGNLFYNGNMLLINHGQGLITAYSHLSKFSKKDGSWVKQADVIGEVGSTGRVTGPHLHWSVYLGGEAINPDLFLEDANP